MDEPQAVEAMSFTWDKAVVNGSQCGEDPCSKVLLLRTKSHWAMGVPGAAICTTEKAPTSPRGMRVQCMLWDLRQETINVYFYTLIG